MVRKTVRPRKATGLDFDRLSWMHIQQLLHGSPANEVWGFKAADELAATWKLHRTRLLELFEHERRPWEQKPFGEWLTEIIPQYGERLATEFFQRRFGERRPHLLRWGILHTHCSPPLQESEDAYLRRHGVI